MNGYAQKHLAIIVVALLAWLAIPPLYAEDEEDGEITLDLSESYDFKRLSGMEARFQPHGDDLMGDSIDKDTGAITFTHTDVSIPGNSGLEVALRRKKGQGEVPYTPFQHGFGDWLIDLPIAHVAYGHASSNTPRPVFDNGCLNIQGPMDNGVEIGGSQGTTFVDPEVHMTGVILYVPGKGLSGYPGSPKTPADPANDWTSAARTTDFAGRCATVVIAPDGTRYKFGRHTFRRASSNQVLYSFQICDGFQGCRTETAPAYLQRTYAVYLITEVQDVHGNWVRYDYTSDRAELTRIYSNDGREIRLHYASTAPNSQGRNSRRVTHVTAHGRTWNYEYTGSTGGTTPPPPAPPPPPPGPGPGPDPDPFPGPGPFPGPVPIIPLGGSPIVASTDPLRESASGTIASTGSTEPYRFLHKVILPDGRYWRLGDANNYGMRNIQQEPHNYYLCVPYDVTFDLKHPDGAVGTFRLRETRHIKGAKWVGDIFYGDTPGHYMWPMNIPNVTNNNDCNGTRYRDPNGEFPWERPDGWPVYRTMAVASKTISGAGLPTATWSFQYRNYSGGALDNNWTRVTNPNGSTTTYTYQAIGDNHGQLLSSQTTSSSGASETVTYEYGQTGQGAPGGTYGYCRAEGAHPSENAVAGRCLLYMKRPITKMVRQRDGDTYTTEYTYNFNPASSGYSSSPSTVRKYASLSGSTAHRVRTTTYQQNTSRWIRDLPRTITQNGRQLTSYSYDSLGRLTSQTRYGQPHATFTYHSDGNVATTRDALGRQVYSTNYKRGVAQNVRRPDNRWVYVTVDDNGWVTSTRDALGRITAYSRDVMGRLTRINPPGSWSDTVITYNFNGGGAVQTITRGQSRETITYDKMYRPILERTQTLDTGWSSYVNTRYNASGDVQFQSQPSTNPNETRGLDYTYDGLGRIYQERENVAPFATTRHRYYSQGRHRIYDPSGAFTQYYQYGYDGPGSGNYRAIYRYSSTGSALQYTYLYKNVHGQMTRLRQWGNTNGYSVDQSQYFYYDSQQRLCRHYVPEHGATRYQYDAAGQVIAYAKGQSNSGCGAIPSSSARVAQQFDALGRLTVTNYSDPSTPDITRNYDAMNLRSVYRGGVNWSYNYNDLDLPTHEYLDVDGRSYVLTNYYNSSGYLNRRILPSNRNIYYGVDGLGRFRSVYNGTSSPLVSNATFHPNGAVATMAYGNGQNFTQTLNARQLTQRLQSVRGTQIALYENYGYNAQGKVTSISNSYTNDNRTFGYDGLGRLISASGSWGSGSFVYDALDNLRQKRLGSRTVSLTYDSRNRLTRSTDTGPSGTRTVYYDARGNVTRLGSQNFVYDYSDQPVTASGTATGNYKYDGNLKRVRAVINGKTIYNVYDMSGALVHVDQATDNRRTDYVTGPMGPVARITNNAITYLHLDHLGTPITGTNTAGNIVWREKYTPYGEELLRPSANNEQAGFTGHIRDEATGLNYMQARYYDPIIGRFLSVDPMTFLDVSAPGQFNRYAYTWNDPLNATDPNGEILKLAKAAFNVVRRTVKNGGNVGKAMKDELVSIADNAATLADGQLTIDDAFAVLDLATGFGGEAKRLTGRGSGGGGGGAAGRTDPPGGGGSSTPKEGIYEFPDQANPGQTYVGQSGNIPERLKQHEAAGRYTPGTATTTSVSGGKTQREIAEHNRIQEITGGVPARHSDAVSNKKDPIGPARRHLLDEE
ncbi:MAG: RHS repeat-associated core domain-containing protein [Pseudomonadota bacterium]